MRVALRGRTTALTGPRQVKLALQSRPIRGSVSNAWLCRVLGYAKGSIDALLRSRQERDLHDNTLCTGTTKIPTPALYHDPTLVSASRIRFCVSLNFRIPNPRRSPYGTHIKLLYGEGSSRSAHKKITTVTQVNAEAFITKDRSFGPFVFLILK